MDTDNDVAAASRGVHEALSELTAAIEGGDEDAAISAGADLRDSLSDLRARSRGTAGENALSWAPAYIEFGEDTDYRNPDLVVHTASWLLAVTDMERWMREGAERARRGGSEDELSSPGQIVGALFYQEMRWPDDSVYEQIGLSAERVDQSSLYLTTRTETGLEPTE